VASFVAAAELVVLVVLAIVLLAKPIARTVQHHAEAAARAPAPKVKPVPTHRRHVVLVAKVPRSKLGIVVLNGNGRSGAAATASSTLSALGYHIRSTANAKRQNYATSVVMYRRGYSAEGARLARDLHIKVVGPLDGMGVKGLDGGQLVVILGAR
jgi:LytR cell envelope-related transcriptional attenuator